MKREYHSVPCSTTGRQPSSSARSSTGISSRSRYCSSTNERQPDTRRPFSGRPRGTIRFRLFVSFPSFPCTPACTSSSAQQETSIPASAHPKRDRPDYPATEPAGPAGDQLGGSGCVTGGASRPSGRAVYDTPDAPQATLREAPQATYRKHMQRTAETKVQKVQVLFLQRRGRLRRPRP